ncbi:DUF2157 domain-containing protein [Alteromonas sp. KUL49]|uniref:DUF2157 domain-containing protein n=1 Tax=Alteromonas sp. KUL49 TaxID=2480798 RepID=UPI00102F12DA|nr:DUF2157 domain-containing protein [Alteromonas sp. KUL49]TAP40834.1 DUF2157 domain-containing protein [Alteromonas sp. KUL49]GEA11012.1 hypothetical protein KUL49_13870 [Alteromonas sp. KUL49]
MDSQHLAQQRCDQINAFNKELETLEREGVFILSESSRQSVSAHHEQLLRDLSASFDIDSNNTAKQLSIGMKVASLFGAIALSASVFFLFYQYWGLLTTTIQTLVLVASPLIMLGITAIFSKHEDSGYFAKISGLLAVCCFVLNLSMFGKIYNLPSSPNAFLIWSLFSLLLGYKVRSRVLLTFAILSFAAYLSARMGMWFGIYWLSFGERPENFFLPALLIFALGHLVQKHYENFAPVYRAFGSLLLLIPVLVLSHWANGSYLPYSREFIEGSYQLAGFAISAGLVWYGVYRNWNESINLGTVFFIVFYIPSFTSGGGIGSQNIYSSWLLR